MFNSKNFVSQQNINSGLNFRQYGHNCGKIKSQQPKLFYGPTETHFLLDVNSNIII